MPLVSVLMPIKGHCPHLSKAIRSVQSQTLGDWELLICKDHIDDSSSRYLKDVVEKDSRIKIIETIGLFLPSALNKGLDECGGEFTARFDSDDVMLPGRLHSQVLFLQQNPEYVVCGGQIVVIDQNDKLAFFSPYYSLNDRKLKQRISYKCPFPHPASTIRTRNLREVLGYSARYKFAEDYELWWRLSSLGKFANLKEPVIAYRNYPSQTSARFQAETRLFMANALLENLNSEDKRVALDRVPVTKGSFQKLYLSLDEPKRAIVDRYYKNEPFLADMSHKPPTSRSKTLLLKGIFDIIYSFPRKLEYMILSLRLSVYSFIRIRPVWNRFMTTFNPELITSKKVSNWTS